MLQTSTSIIDTPEIVARLMLGIEGESRKVRETYLEDAFCGRYRSKKEYALQFYKEAGTHADSERDLDWLVDDLFENHVMAVSDGDMICVFIRPEVLEEYP